MPGFRRVYCGVLGFIRVQGLQGDGGLWGFRDSGLLPARFEVRSGEVGPKTFITCRFSNGVDRGGSSKRVHGEISSRFLFFIVGLIESSMLGLMLG